MLRRDPFGHVLWIKRLLISLIGAVTWRRYTRINRIQIDGAEVLRDLPSRNVLFVSNHQTYFADVIALLHIFSAVKNGRVNTLERPSYLLKPKINNYFVAAVETMQKGILPRLFAYVGSVSVERTWKAGEKEVNRKVRMDDISSIGKALSEGWVINFPQGTTKPFAKGRRGVILLLKKYDPVIVPVVVNGFNTAFDKKGLKIRKKGTSLSVRFKAPLVVDTSLPADAQLELIMDAIEQSDKFNPVLKQVQ